MDFFLQLAVILACLLYGARKGGIALGLLGGIGLMILVFGFHLQPGKPPVDVMLVIIAVVAASATLQASGGLDVMLQIAERMLRRNPRYVSIIAPFVTCILTILCGTGHVVYTILPIIYDVAIKITSARSGRWRPARSARRWVLSPARFRWRWSHWWRCSAVTPSMAAIWNSSTCSLSPYLLRCAAFWRSASSAGSAAKTWTKTRSSRNSSQCRKTIAMSMAMPPPTGSGAATQQLDRHVDFPRHHRTGGGAGAFSDLRPSFGGKPLSMVLVIQMCMLMAGALIVIITRTNPASISKTKCSAPA